MESSLEYGIQAVSKVFAENPYYRSRIQPIELFLDKLSNSPFDFTGSKNSLLELRERFELTQQIALTGIMLSHGIQDEALESWMYSQLTQHRVRDRDPNPSRKAMVWLLGRNPDDPVVWAWFEKLVDSPSALHPDYHLKYLTELKRPSKRAVDLLKSISESDTNPAWSTAKLLLKDMESKGLLIE